MSCQEAYDHGKETFRTGGDVNNIPSHYTETERELFILGYEEAERFEDEDQSDLDFEDDDYDEDDPVELDFN